MVQEISRRLAYQYPYRALSQLLSKRAASSLDEPKEEDAGFAVSRPAFLSQGGLTPGQRGTAMHGFMQYCDYHGAQADLESEIRRLTDSGVLADAAAQALDWGKLNTFFHGPLAKRMFSSANLMREIRFSTFVQASRLYSELGEDCDEDVFVQGIADCVFEEDGALVVVDYKTDRVKEADVLLERYRSQLSFYKEAIEKTLEQPVRECLLYSFHHGRGLRYDFL
ncbi:MAG: PD-(D/E)XK nuclease family protein [Clostridiales bacterium]|nr:PD-(D/E)XK nuclease family protein [Clostridiales bacterium]